MKSELRALIKRFIIEAVRREMTDSKLASYDDNSIAYAEQQVERAFTEQLAALRPEDFRG